jgi:quinol monooxygenase YgiN
LWLGEGHIANPGNAGSSACVPDAYLDGYHEDRVMTAFNVVRFKVKPGMDEAFLDAHRNISDGWSGMRHANIIKTGEGRYCIIAEWESAEALAAGRPGMIATLDSFRHTLEDLGGGLGITDPVSGPVILSMK